MKKLVFTVLISGSVVYAFSQTTTDFETWTGSGASIEPTGWISANALTLLPGNPQSVSQATSPDNHGGTYAMKISSVLMTNPLTPTTVPNPIGLAATGVLSGSALKFGYPFTARPASVDFWYKYSPAAPDTAEFLALLWNSATGDTLAFGYWSTAASVASYMQQSVPLTYDPAFSSEYPDSIALTFSSTRLFTASFAFCTTCGKAGSNLWVDDIGFTGWNGVSEHPGSRGVSVFPNPASDFVNISVDAVNDAYSVNAFDNTGRIISTTALSARNSMTRKSGVINTSGFSAGLYSFAIMDKNGAAIRAGKFNVVR